MFVFYIFDSFNDFTSWPANTLKTFQRTVVVCGRHLWSVEVLNIQYKLFLDYEHSIKDANKCKQ